MLQQLPPALPSVAQATAMSSSTQAHDPGQKAEVMALTEKLLHEDSTLRFMLGKLEEAGCPFPRERITVSHCEESVLGMFHVVGGPRLDVCYNRYQDRPDELRNTILHELVHAYDFCRGKDMDFFNCKHLACTEVRAARLSGDCSMKMEGLRGRMPVPGYERACVKRRAQLSVSMMAQCKLTAAAHVLSCLEECYQDTAPFSLPP